MKFAYWSFVVCFVFLTVLAIGALLLVWFGASSTCQWPCDPCR